MSIGYGGACTLIENTDVKVVYSYRPYNLNEPKYRNQDHIFDGRITIYKEAFVEPEIHRKKHRKSNGKKRVLEKRIRRDVDYAGLLAEKKIIIENSQFCWETYGAGYGMIALKIVRRIFDEYQDTGEIPKSAGYTV